MIENEKHLDISVAINCTTLLGTQTIKCEGKPIDSGKLLSSGNSAHSLCQSFGVQSIDQLDVTLAGVFNESVLNAGRTSPTGTVDTSLS